MRKVYWLLLALPLLAGCKIKYERPMTEAAQLTADRICGVYRLVDATWDGEPLDLDGDGEAQTPFLRELLEGEYLGFQYHNEDIDVVVSPVYSSQLGSSSSFLFFYGEYSASYFRDGIPLYKSERITCEYKVLEDGSAEVKARTSYLDDYVSREDYFDLRDIEFTWDKDGDGDFLLSATTGYYNHLTQQHTVGRETFRYHCISTKEKKQK